MALVAGLSSCTPKPDVADDVAQEFLDLLEGDRAAASNLTDQPQDANLGLQTSWDALQAEAVETELLRVNTQDNVATAQYRLDWALPGGRNWTYEASMFLTKAGDEWVVRWQPSVLHPDLGAAQHLELRKVAAPTANVVGSDGAVLLEPGSITRVLIDMTANNTRGLMERLGQILDGMRANDPTVPAFDAAAKIAESQEVTGRFAATILTPAQAQLVQEQLQGAAGIIFNEEFAMVRPDPNFAPDILARVNTLVADDLKGEDGWKVVVANAEGAELSTLTKQEPKSNPSVHVSLSRTVQEAAQAAVDTRADAEAMMVVMRPSTGEILAIAQTARADEKGNLALTGQYPPGSTFKMITAYAGMAKEGLTPDSIVGCPGTQNIGGRIVTNYNGFSLGNTALEHAFAKSCNTTFAEMSTQLQPGELEEYAKQFGLGVDFDIEGLETITGSVPRGEVMLDRTEAGYGQGLDLTSPFGMAVVASTAATGKLTTPFLIAGANHSTDVEGESAQQLDPEKVQGLQSMMRAVVTYGTGSGIAGAGEVYGKTGEAEISGGSHSWFAGYRGDIAFATLVVLGGGSQHAVGITNHFFQNLDAATEPPV